MPHLISNLYEKNYTPFTAKLAPRDLCNRPAMGKFIKYINKIQYVINSHFIPYSISYSSLFHVS